MCLTLLSVGGDDQWPLRVLSFREEFLEREWDMPAPWWPEHPGVVGGRDKQAGGTWLAVQPGACRVAAIHTSFVERVPAERRRTRGDVPLMAAAGVPWFDADLSGYDDFTLLTTEPGTTTWHEYRDGSLAMRRLDPGVHAGSVAGLGAVESRPRQGRWLEVAARDGLPQLDAGGSPEADWLGWLERTGASALDPADPLALVIRRSGRGREFGTSSVSSVAADASGAVHFHMLAVGLSGAMGDAWYAATAASR